MEVRETIAGLTTASEELPGEAISEEFEAITMMRGEKIAKELHEIEREYLFGKKERSRRKRRTGVGGLRQRYHVESVTYMRESIRERKAKLERERERKRERDSEDCISLTLEKCTCRVFIHN